MLNSNSDSLALALITYMLEILIPWYGENQLQVSIFQEISLRELKVGNYWLTLCWKLGGQDKKTKVLWIREWVEKKSDKFVLKSKVSKYIKKKEFPDKENYGNNILEKHFFLLSKLVYTFYPFFNSSFLIVLVNI